MTEDKSPEVWIFEITYEFAVVASNPEAARQKLLDIKGEDYERFKELIRYKRMKHICSIPLVPQEMLERSGKDEDS